MDALCSHRSSGRTSAQTRDPLFAQDVDKNGPVDPALLTTYESAEQKPVLSFPSSSWLSFQPRSVILLSTTIFGLFQQAALICRKTKRFINVGILHYTDVLFCGVCILPCQTTERIIDFTQADPIPAACVNLTFTDFL